MFIELMRKMPPIKGQRKSTTIFESKFYNINRIEAFNYDANEELTRVETAWDREYVKETPEEILKLIKKASKN